MYLLKGTNRENRFRIADSNHCEKQTYSLKFNIFIVLFFKIIFRERAAVGWGEVEGKTERKNLKPAPHAQLGSGCGALSCHPDIMT